MYTQDSRVSQYQGRAPSLCYLSSLFVHSGVIRPWENNIVNTRNWQHIVTIKIVSSENRFIFVLSTFFQVTFINLFFAMFLVFETVTITLHNILAEIYRKNNVIPNNRYQEVNIIFDLPSSIKRY